MRKAGAVVADVLLKLQELAKPGMTTEELDKIALKMSALAGAEPLFKGVRNPQARNPFPGAICASINEQIVHGIPSPNAKAREGDILSIDFGIRLNGYCADAALTTGIGKVSEESQRLMEVTKHVLNIAISRCAPAVKWSDIAGEMQDYAEAAGFSVVRDFAGHGKIGRAHV